MFDELLEDIAQRNGLREVNTSIKLAAGIGGILLCLLSSSYFTPLCIALLLACAILFLAGVDAKTYSRTLHGSGLVCVFQCCRYHLYPWRR